MMRDAVIRLLAAWLLCFSPQSAAGSGRETTTRVSEPVFQGELHYMESGPRDAPTVVLVHGIGEQAARDWDGLTAELAREFRVVRFDLPGFGRSSKGNHAYTPDNYAAVLRHLIDRQVRSRPVFLVGHSMGGAIALRYAAQYPQDVRAMVLASVPGILHRLVYSKHLAAFGLGNLVPGLSANQNGQVDNLLGNLLGRVEQKQLPVEFILGFPQLRERVLNGEPARIAGLALALEDFGQDIARVQAPTLLLWGDRDQIAPLRNGRILAAGLPNARLEILEGSGHSLMNDLPEVFESQVRRFLRDPLVPRGRNALRDEEVWPDSTRRARCENQRGRIFEGDYDRIVVRRCTGVKIRNARVRKLQIDDSEVRIVDSRIGIGTDSVGLTANDSRLAITSSRIEGKVAIRANRARLDVAGSRVVGHEAGVVTDSEAEVVFSVSRLESPQHHGRLHGLRKVLPDDPL